MFIIFREFFDCTFLDNSNSDGYVGVLQAQGGAIYETHTLQIRDSLNKYVELPTRTRVTVAYKDGTPIYEKELDASSSQIRFSMGDVLHATNKEYTIKFDFSRVTNNDFYQAFSGTSSTEYTLMDSMYLSSSEGTLGIGPQSTEKIFTVKRVSKVKLAVVPKDNRYLGINLAQGDEETNSGIIDFTVSARFDFPDGKNFHQAEISFSVKKKEYDSVSGKYTYVDLKAEEAGIWTVYKGDKAVTGDTLQIEKQEGIAEYTLHVNKEHGKLDLTNYRFMVHLTATADDGSIVEADDDFVFLICQIETEPGF